MFQPPVARPPCTNFALRDHPVATPVASGVAGDITAELDGVTSHGVPGKEGV